MHSKESIRCFFRYLSMNIQKTLSYNIDYCCFYGDLTRHKNQFHTFTYSWCIGLSAILQSDWSRAFWPMTQRIFLEMGFVMRGQELHEFSLGLFSAKLITKLMKKTNKISYFGSFLSKYGQNWISHKEWVLLVFR